MECVPFQNQLVFDVLNAFEVDLIKCTNVIKIRSSEACPKVNYYIISKYISDYKIFAGIIVILIGTFLVFFGVKFVKVTVLVVTVLASNTLILLVYFSFVHPSGELSVWIILAVASVIGLGVGFCLCKMTKGFVILIGGYLGYLLSVFLYDIILNNIRASPQVVFWVTTVSCVVICGLLALWLVKIAIVIATSVIGGYMMVRGASFYIGFFPSESIVMDLISNEEWKNLDQVN
jgi:hypothetical protein